MNNEQRIEEMRLRLTNALNTTDLVFTDDSHQHVGHAGAAGGAGHFTLKISASDFSELSRVKCHQLVYKAVGDLIPTEVHALRIIIE